MIVECKYKDKNTCSQNGNLNCDNCNLQLTLYFGEDKKKLISELHKDLKNVTDIEEIEGMKFVHGHCSQDPNDFDSISYDVYNIRLVELKKYTLLNDYNFCTAIWIMKQMHYKLPNLALKRYQRKLKSIRNTVDEKLYLSSIKKYFKDLSESDIEKQEEIVDNAQNYQLNKLKSLGFNVDKCEISVLNRDLILYRFKIKYLNEYNNFIISYNLEENNCTIKILLSDLFYNKWINSRHFDEEMAVFLNNNSKSIVFEQNVSTVDDINNFLISIAEKFKE